MANLTLVSEDKNYHVEFEIRKDANGQLVDLTHSSILFRIREKNEEDLIIEKAGSVVDAELGLCQILILDELESRFGEFHGEIKIHSPSGKILTASGISVKVLKNTSRGLK